MDPKREQLRQRLKDYYISYYAELRKLITNHPADPGQVPHFLRGHARIITISECADGYVVTHRAAPHNGHTDGRETFVLVADDWDRTVGDATGKDYSPYSDFDETEAPFVREESSGEYAKPSDFESRDFVSNDRLARRTVEAARREAGEVIREFFAQNPPCDPR
jgi:hypothetical protein